MSEFCYDAPRRPDSDLQEGIEDMSFGLALIIEEAKKNGWTETDEEKIERDLIVPADFVKVHTSLFAVAAEGKTVPRQCITWKLSFRCKSPMSNDPEIHAEVLKNAVNEMKYLGITHVYRLIEKVPVACGIKAPWSEVICRGCIVVK
jgi:hypothetical protein